MLSRICQNKGLYRVQKSVFLGNLNSNERDSLALECEQEIDPEVDSVYVFPMDDVLIQESKTARAGIRQETGERRTADEIFLIMLMTDSETIITISDVLEYLFCPRFIYYMHCLDIPQHEEKRFKVMKGREVHEKKMITNPEYLRKKLGVVKKEINVFIASKQHHIKGIVDEVLIP